MLSSKQLQAEIDSLEASLEPANTELDHLYGEFGKALPADVEQWMKSHVKRRVEENSGKINAGGVEPLRQIKAEFAALIQRLPQLCDAALGERDQWPHRKKSSNPGQYESRSGETYSAACFRRSINHLGTLLAKHGLVGDKTGYVGEWEVAGGHYRYAINPGFDERRFPVLKEYQEKRVAQATKHKELEAKIEEHSKAKARELWDDA